MGGDGSGGIDCWTEADGWDRFALADFVSEGPPAFDLAQGMLLKKGFLGLSFLGSMIHTGVSEKALMNHLEKRRLCRRAWQASFVPSDKIPRWLNRNDHVTALVKFKDFEHVKIIPFPAWLTTGTIFLHIPIEIGGHAVQECF